MMSISESWARLTRTSPVLRFVDANLRGAGQVMLQDNPLTGLLFIAGISWGAIAAGAPQVAIGALVGLVVATATAIYLRVDQPSLCSGLYGYNGMLVGVSLPTLLAPEPLLWAYLIFGAAVSVVVMMAISNLVRPWGISALTAPYVLTTGLLLLASHDFAHLKISDLPPPAFPQIQASVSTMTYGAEAVMSAVLLGVSQIFLIGNAATGAIFLAALFVNSIWATVFALAGSMLAVACALVLGADSKAIADGLYGFSPVLTAIAVGAVFHTPRPRVVVYTIVAVIFAVIVQAALDVALLPFGTPTLTAPFVATTWLFLLPRRSSTPTPHVRGSDDSAQHG